MFPCWLSCGRSREPRNPILICVLGLTAEPFESTRRLTTAPAEDTAAAVAAAADSEVAAATRPRCRTASLLKGLAMLSALLRCTHRWRTVAATHRRSPDTAFLPKVSPLKPRLWGEAIDEMNDADRPPTLSQATALRRMDMRTRPSSSLRSTPSSSLLPRVAGATKQRLARDAPGVSF